MNICEICVPSDISTHWLGEFRAGWGHIVLQWDKDKRIVRKDVELYRTPPYIGHFFWNRKCPL